MQDPIRISFDPEHPETFPRLVACHTADKSETWEAIAKRFYSVGRDDPDPLKVAVEWLRAANPGLGQRVNADESILVPSVPGITPRRILAQEATSPLKPVSVPQIPTTDQPPDPTPPIDPTFRDQPPLSEPVDGIVQQTFQDTIDIGCTYYHNFVIRRGPIQQRKKHFGEIVWVKWIREITTAVFIQVTGVSNVYVVLLADLFVVQRWQWQEVWDCLYKVCPGGSVTHGRFIPIAGSGKWVHLTPDQSRRGEPHEIHSEHGALDAPKDGCVDFANTFHDADPQNVVRGTDEL